MFLQIPQISYASTAAELSDKTRYEYFTRVVPPDSYQSSAMAEIVKDLGWTYVHTLADEGNYGEKGIAAFEAAARKKGICFSKQLKIKTSLQDSEEHYEEIISTLSQDLRARVVVLFVADQNIKKFLVQYQKSAKKYGLNELHFLASDSWGTKTTVVEGILPSLTEGAITLLPKREVDAGFSEYYVNLRQSHANMNPWWLEFWQRMFNCSNSKNLGSPQISFRSHCIQNGTIEEHFRQLLHQKYDQQGYVPMVIDSVYAIAHAVKQLIKAKCPEISKLSKKRILEFKMVNRSSLSTICPLLFPEPNGSEILRFLREVEFSGR